MFVWTTTSQLASPTFWIPGEPNDPDGHTEDCATIYGNGNEYAWKDHSCADKKYSFVCEML